MKEVWHSGFVRTGDHILPHAVLRVPYSQRPKCPASIGEDGASLKPPRLFHLPKRAIRVQYEQRDEANRPNPEPGYADKAHKLSVIRPRSFFREEYQPTQQLAEA